MEIPKSLHNCQGLKRSNATSALRVPVADSASPLAFGIADPVCEPAWRRPTHLHCMECWSKPFRLKHRRFPIRVNTNEASSIVGCVTFCHKFAPTPPSPAVRHQNTVPPMELYQWKYGSLIHYNNKYLFCSRNCIRIYWRMECASLLTGFYARFVCIQTACLCTLPRIIAHNFVPRRSVEGADPEVKVPPPLSSWLRTSDLSRTNSRATSSDGLWERMRRMVQPVSSRLSRRPSAHQHAQAPLVPSPRVSVLAVRSRSCRTVKPMRRSARPKQ